MWNFIWGLFTGPVSSLTKQLADVYLAKQNATTEQARIEADKQIAELSAQRDIILKAQSDPIERFVRIGFALPYIIYLWKLILWDKVFEWGVTDPLSPELSMIWMIILGGYFVDMGIKRIFKR